jgi:hypothetical protein
LSTISGSDEQCCHLAAEADRQAPAWAKVNPMVAVRRIVIGLHNCELEAEI